jgi:hypothetical protein
MRNAAHYESAFVYARRNRDSTTSPSVGFPETFALRRCTPRHRMSVSAGRLRPNQQEARR